MSSLRNNYARITGQPHKPKFLTCTQGGDGVTTNANLDFSIIEGRYYFECPADDAYTIEGFDMHVSGASNIRRDGYGDLNGGLTNGVDWYSLINGVETIITPLPPIKNNEDLLGLGHKHQRVDYASNDSTHLYSADLFTFSDGFGLLTPGDRIGVILRDDFRTVVTHQFQLRAWNYDGISRA